MAPTMTTTPAELDPREQRGLIIAAKCRLKRKGNVWLVPSQSSGIKYSVTPHPTEPHCTCPDHEVNGCKCKHIYAVEITVKREENEDGTVTETVTMTQTVRKTYKQDWSAYNRAQCNEKEQFLLLLRDLVKNIPEQPTTKTGRKPFPIRDAIFAACYKVFSTVSGRRFMSDLRDAKEKGYIARVPSYNMIFKVFDRPETFDILKALVVRAAQPLTAVESHFSCDSTGFSGCRFDRWFSHKWGDVQIKRAWVKCHVMTGAKTNIVTAVEIHGQNAGDSPLLPVMLNTTRERFDVKEVSADLGYSAASNLQAIEDAGAAALIPFKSNTTASKGGIWERLFHYFNFNREEFLSRYHLRSNVESTFSMIKAKFRDGLRSKTDTAMKNEVLAKLVCHNIVVLIQSMYELGINPSLWAENAVAHKPEAI
jgi:hypothetical protein